MIYFGAIGLLFALSFADLVLAVRLALRQDRAFRRRMAHHDVLTFDLARAGGIVGMVWAATTLAMLVEPQLGSVPILAAGRYTMAATTALLFTGIAVGAIAFLVFRLRHLRGRHEWQLPDMADAMPNRR